MVKPSFHSDRPAAVDALGRLSFASGLSRALALPAMSPGIVVGLEGDWGCGKSTVIQLVLSNFKTWSVQEQPIVLQFNPWLISSTGNLIESFLQELAGAICTSPITDRAKRKIKVSKRVAEYIGALRYLKYAGLLQSVIPTEAGGVLDALTMVGQGVDQGQPKIKAALEQLESVLPTMTLAERKKAVEGALARLDRPIVVVIDDLDRLLPEEMRTIFQMIKAVADFPRTTYLLAYDKKAVADSISSFGIAGESYLEKIIQVAYPVPPIFGWKMNDFLSESVTSLMERLNINLMSYEKEIWPQALRLAADMCRTPRDATRLTNRLMISLPATVGNVNAADVIVFEALSQRFEGLRAAVLRYPGDFAGIGFRDRGAAEELRWIKSVGNEREEAEQRWRRHLPEEPHTQELAARACKFLFPRLSGTTGEEPEHTLRIADPDRLARLFSLTSLEIVPEASWIHELLSDGSLLAFEFQRTPKDSFSFMLGWLENFLPSSERVDIPGCIDALSHEAQRQRNEGSLTDNDASSIGRLINRLLERRPDGFEKIFEQLVSTSILCVAEDVLIASASEHGYWGGSKYVKPANERLIGDPVVVERAIVCWCQRVLDANLSNNLASEPALHSILFRLAQLDSFGKVYEVIQKLTSTYEGLERFVGGFLSYDTWDLDHLKLIEDPCAFTDLIAENLQPSKNLERFLKTISTPDAREKIVEQAAKLKDASSKRVLITQTE